MILKIWLKLFSILLLVLIPLITVQYLMQKESIDLVFDLAEKGNAGDLLESHMANLKKLSRLEPGNSEQYHGEFERAVESRNLNRDMKLVRRNLVNDLLMQTLRNTFLILVLILALTYLIARSIVTLLRRLVAENQTHSLRLERLSALESWQKIARMMVHEMRAPVTPIKLVATDIETKYRTLEPERFGRYLASGAELIRAQVTSIERLTDGLTKFAKLPDVRKNQESISEFLEQFIATYRDYGSGEIDLSFTPAESPPIGIDRALLNLLFFNLLKNAHEANPQRKIEVQIASRHDSGHTWITFANTGGVIPESLAGEIFKPHVSSKSDTSASNFGVGLTIAKKIALDHEGDLYLIKNNRHDGVVFELELPNI